MKFIRPLEVINSKFIHFEGEVAELNSSVVDLYKQKLKEQSESPEDIVTQAKQVTLSEVPDAAKDLLDTLGKKFKKPKDLENTKTVEEAKEAVRSMVFDVLDAGISMHDSWGDNLAEMIEDIEADEHEAISTIRDATRGKETVAKLLDQYQREAKIIKDSLSKDNTVKRKLGFLWKTGEVANSSEQALFDKFSANAITEIKAIGEQFSDREKEANTVNKETKAMISDGFKALSPEHKAEFLTLVKQELASNPPTDHLNGAGPDEIRAVVTGTHVLNRIEIYHEIFDLQAAQLLTQSSRRVDEQIQAIADRETFIDNQTKAVLTEANINKVRTALNDSIADPSFQSSDLGTLNADLKLFFQTAGLNLNDHFTLTGSATGKALSANQLNDYETFVALFDAMQTHDSKLKGMPQALKKRVLAACNWLEGLSVAENEEGYSKEFLDLRKEIYESQDRIRKSIDNDISGIKSIEDLQGKSTEITSLRRRIGMFSVAKSHLEAADLTDTEKAKLVKVVAATTPIIEKVEALLDEWERSLISFSQTAERAKQAWETAKAQKVTLEAQKQRADDYFTDLNNRGITGDVLNNATADVARKAVEVSNKNTEITALKTEFDKFASGGSKAPNTPVTESEKFLAAHRPVLVDIDKQLKALNKAKTASIRTDVLASHFVYNSMRQNKALYKERFEQLQAEQFELLKGCNQGQALNIKIAPFTHGHGIPDTSTMSALKGFNKAIVMEKTADAVVLIAGTKIIVVQQSTESQKFQVLQMAAPRGFKKDSKLPPDYFPENAVIVGELIKLNAA